MKLLECLESIKQGTNAKYKGHKTEDGHKTLKDFQGNFDRLQAIKTYLDSDGNESEDDTALDRQYSFRLGSENGHNLDKLDQLIAHHRLVVDIFKWTLAQADQLKADSESKT
jgi:hypothetical protein